MTEVALALWDARTHGNRTASFVSGGVYRSQFLRDFCACVEVSAFLSEIAGVSLLPHTMPSQQIYINYAPDDLGQAVDTWHTDGICFDMVMMISDPSTFEGGRFEYFCGTRDEAAPYLKATATTLTEVNCNDLPKERVMSAEFPAAGYAVFQNGGLVVHRATRLKHPAQRITMVPGYVAGDVRMNDPTRDVVANWAEPGMKAEFARHKAWLARARLDALVNALPLIDDPQLIHRELKWAVADVEKALELIHSEA